jgi:hypothetical protein
MGSEEQVGGWLTGAHGPGPAEQTSAAPYREPIAAALRQQAPATGQRWLAGGAARIAAEPTAVRGLFPAAGRQCGRGPLESCAPQLRGWTVDDAARVLLLLALPLADAALAEEVAGLYRHGDAAEKRAVLRGLAALPVGAGGLPLVQDALRTNDTRLVAAALGPYGAANLDPPAYRQGVLKCVFLGIPLAGIDGLPERADRELFRMLRSFAAERAAAGRPIPADVTLPGPDLAATEP